MTCKSLTAAVAAATALLCAGTAWAQVEHAQRTALDVAIRRAQLRAALCAPPQIGRMAPSHSASRPTASHLETLLPPAPPVGTAGPVQVGDCSYAQALWPLGR